MNTYKKFCPNVFVAQCEKEYQKGDVITVTTKRGKENECVVFNFVGYTGTKENPLFCYSIVRTDGFNVQEWAKRKAERIRIWESNANEKSTKYWKESHEGKDFLSLAEPIKVGHHSEKRHRALIQRNYDRMGKCVEYSEKANEYGTRAEYWESRTNIINLSMPESIEFFQYKYDEAVKHHKGLKDGTIKRDHSYSLTYAKKEVNNMSKKLKLAQRLWA